MVAALRPAACSLTRTTLDGRTVLVSGLASRAAEAALHLGVRDMLPANVTPDAVSWHLDMFDGPYCPVLDTLRPASTTPLGLGLRNGVRRLHKDQDIVPQVTMPDFPGWLQLDYFSSDGGLAHLHPTALGPARQDAARAIVTFGGTPQERWQVDAPFGTDMIVAIASSAPLFNAPRPADESAADYLQALRAALADATRKGVRIATGAMLLDTTER